MYLNRDSSGGLSMLEFLQSRTEMGVNYDYDYEGMGLLLSEGSICKCHDLFLREYP